MSSESLQKFSPRKGIIIEVVVERSEEQRFQHWLLREKLSFYWRNISDCFQPIDTSSNIDIGNFLCFYWACKKSVVGEAALPHPTSSCKSRQKVIDDPSGTQEIFSPPLSPKRAAFFSREIIPVLSTHFLPSLVFCGAKFAPPKPAFLFSLHFHQHLFVTWFVRPTVPDVTWYRLLRSHDALMWDNYLYKLCHRVILEIIPCLVFVPIPTFFILIYSRKNTKTHPGRAYTYT